MAITLLRYSVAILLLLLAGGLILAAFISTQQTVTVRVAFAAGGIISGLLGVGCIVNPELAKRVIVGSGIDKT